MSRSMTYVVAYDIVDDRRRYRVANLLKNYGVRVQRSVFECRLDETELSKLTGGLRKLIALREDSVLIYRQCAACLAERNALGTRPPRDEEVRVL